MTTEEIKAYKHHYYVDHKEVWRTRYRVKHRIWVEANRTALRQSDKEKYWANVEATRATRNAKRQGSQGDLLRAREREYNRTQLARRKEYRKLRWPRDRETRKRWLTNNPALVKAQDHARKALLRKAPGKWKGTDIQWLFMVQGGRCKYCGASLVERFEIDHVIPVTRRGTNWPDNLALACKPCNRSKLNKDLDDFLKYLEPSRA